MNDLTAILAKYGSLDAYQACPDFWTPKPQQAQTLIDSLKQATIRTIGRSAAGREIIALEYGEKEPLETITSNLHSALAAKVVPADPTEIYPESFYGKQRRSRPAVVFQGGIHGGELTGTVATFNLCQIIETGRDLRGREWPTLARLARETRICIIPWLNPDGVERWLLPNPIAAEAGLITAFTQGVTSDGTFWTYPEVKAYWPIPVERTAYMGSYYNDQGVNLQYDFAAVERQPETTAWMKYYLDERPDGVVIWHCDGGSLIGIPSYYLPEGVQAEAYRMAGAARSRVLREGYPCGRTSWQLPGMGKPNMEQMTATYHVCGGTPVMCELPLGGKNYPYSLDDLLDIGLLVIEEILAYAHDDGLRAYESWYKVRARLTRKAQAAS